MQIKTISAVGASTAYLAREHRRKAKRFIRASFTSLATLILGGNLALSAEPLDLDHTCNGTGQVVTNLHAPLSGFDEGRAVAVQQDGKIVALGATLSQPPKGFDFALVRYSPDCAMDTTFGGGGTGRVITDLGSIDDNPKAIVIQPDGKILVTGDTNTPPGEDVTVDIVLLRYNPDGTLDQSFGTNGVARADFGAYETSASVALQQDGRIVVAGWQQASDGQRTFLIVRYLPDGALDTSFGDSGKVLSGFGDHSKAMAVVVQKDGKILAAGPTWIGNFQAMRGVVARYNPNGTPDGSFNGGLGILCAVVQSCGRVKINLGGGNFDYPVSMALQTLDGGEEKIVISGQFGLARLNSNGSLDKDFGSAGIMGNPDNTGNTVTVLAGGNIAVAGNAFGGAIDFGVAVYENTGQLCSIKGSVTTDFNGKDDVALGMARQPDDKIVVIGKTGTGASADFAVARYEGGSCSHKISISNYVAGHVFIHPQDYIGPPAPLFRDRLFDHLRIGQSEQLVIPASEGGVFAGPARPGYQAFKLTDAGEETRHNGSSLSVTNALGHASLELLEAQHLLVPTEIASEPAGAVATSGLQSVPLMKCYRVRRGNNREGVHRERKHLTVTDALARRRTFEVGEPESLCEPIDRLGRKLIGPTLSLTSYRVKDTSGADRRSGRIPVANEFGARVLEVAPPELVYLPSLAE